MVIGLASYSEIVTKAVIGKGKKSTKTIHEVPVEVKVSKVLGCWIINNEFECVNLNDHVEVQGKYEVHLWYGYDFDTKSDLLKKEVNYIEEIPLKFRHNASLTPEVELKGICSKYPTCVGLTLLKNGNVEVQVEKEYLVDVVGETKLKVQITQQQEEEWTLDDEIDSSVDVNYIKEKKISD